MKRLAAIAVTLAVAAPSRAQCLDLSGSFGYPGTNGGIFDLQVHDDGSGPALYAAGYFLWAGAVQARGLARWDGSSWTAFGDGLGGSIFRRFTSMATFDEGAGPRLFVCGMLGMSFNNPTNPVVARWNGTAWSSLGTGPGGVSGAVVSKLWTLDLGTGPALYAAGNFTTISGVPATNLARWNGTSWSALTSSSAFVVSQVLSLTTFDAGAGPELFAACTFSQNGGAQEHGVARWNGTSWSSVGTAVGWSYPVVASLAAYDDGSGPALYASGAYTSISGVPVQSVARWNGTSWSALPGFSNGATNLEVVDLGAGPMLVLGTYYNGPAFRWDGASWIRLGDSPTGSSGTMEVFDDGGGKRLYVGGGFFPTGSGRPRSIARLETTGWQAVTHGGGVDHGRTVECMLAHDDGAGARLIVGGTFREMGGLAALGVASWNGHEWSLLGDGFNELVLALAHFDAGSGAKLFAGGGFTASGSTSLDRVAAWNGSSWSALNGGPNNTVNDLVVHDDGSGAALYAAGYFSSVGGQAAGRVARWNGTSWSPVGIGMGPNASHYVKALAVHDDGTGAALYAGGNFLSADGQSIYSLAKWNGTTWSAAGNTFRGTVRALLSFDDGSGPALYAGGLIQSASGQYLDSVQRWNGSQWSPVGSLIGQTYALHAYDPGNGTWLYAGGDYGIDINGHRRGLALWNGTSWSFPAGVFPILTSGTSMEVRTLATYDDGTDGVPDLYAGGRFEQHLETAALGITRWFGCAHPGVDFCLGDGSAGPCPCGNSSPTADEAGCANSTGLGARIASTGDPHLGSDTVRLTVSHVPNAASVLFLQSDEATVNWQGFQAGDGLTCLEGQLLRIGIVAASGGVASYPALGQASVSVRGLLGPTGGVRVYQAYYRNSTPFCTSATTNTSQALLLHWTP